MAGEKAVERLRPSILSLGIAVLLIPAILGSSQMIFNDGDVSWHIATGLWILDHRAIPQVDPFSFTWGGKPWVPIEWLAELIYAGAYRVGSYPGVAALVTAALIGLHAAVFLNANRWVRMALLTIVAMDLVLIPMMLARPHVLTWPLLAWWCWLMMRARENDRAPPLVAALLITLWANLHGGYVFGLAIAAAFGLEALVASEDRARAFRQWAIFGVACAAAVFINGNGIEGVLHPLRFTQLEMLPLIDEWKPSNPRTTPFSYGVLAVTLALIVWKRPRVHWVRWLLLAALLGLALLQVRHQSTLAIVAAMLLPAGFARSRREADEPSWKWVILGGAGLLVGFRAMMPIELPENDANPWKLIAAVPADLRSQPVLNGYSMGGPLILSGIRPFVDGRGDMYGDDLVIGFSKMSKGDAKTLRDAVQRWNIRWAIVPNDSKGLVKLLEGTPGWRRIHRDKVGAIYVREFSA
jgi:hypothetical protein